MTGKPTGKPLALTRRDLLRSAALTAATGLVSPAALQARSPENGSRLALDLPVLAQPSLAAAWIGDTIPERRVLSRHGSDWVADGGVGLRLGFTAGEHEANILVEAPSTPIQRIHLRWQRIFAEDTAALGDAWERSYGDLRWMTLRPERAMPWYCMLHANGETVGMGVKAGAAAFAFWQVDAEGISLWLDLRNGGNGVLLGQRSLEAATIVTVVGRGSESAFDVTRRLCATMASGIAVPSSRGKMPVATIFGSNDWYYAYGGNTHDGILRDADLVKSVAPSGTVLPFTVIDDGYQDRSRFPDMAKLASEIVSRGVIPGLWIRPLRANKDVSAGLLLPDTRLPGPIGAEPPRAFDPTIPEALHAILAVVTEACDWGYRLIKHDFTTYELFGMWGSQMGASPTQGNWHFNDRTRTNAEIVAALYRGIRQASGEERLILGCNTVGHLSVGIFDASRTGDDVSGRDWERTRRLGVNTLAYRIAQHRSFYAVDADCVPVTPEVPWDRTRQWLDLVAGSGTVLLISPDPKATGSEQKAAIREAFARCANGTFAEPQDWLESLTPSIWRTRSGQRRYQWLGNEGASPFPVGIQRGPE